ncbi:MAG: hypothetical protein ACRC0B_01855 [Legionella sp.]
MKYQLVIQFPEEICGDLDWIAYLEEIIDQSLIDAELDGHDIGSGEVNIFIETNAPINSFEIVKKILNEQAISLKKTKAGYRDFDSNQYIPVWPEDLVEFNVI